MISCKTVSAHVFSSCIPSATEDEWFQSASMFYNFMVQSFHSIMQFWDSLQKSKGVRYSLSLELRHACAFHTYTSYLISYSVGTSQRFRVLCSLGTFSLYANLPKGYFRLCLKSLHLLHLSAQSYKSAKDHWVMTLTHEFYSGRYCRL